MVSCMPYVSIATAVPNAEPLARLSAAMPTRSQLADKLRQGWSVSVVALADV